MAADVVAETEISAAVVGGTRTPLHDTSGMGRGRQGWGRNKRWEYWAVTTPGQILAMTISALDYAAVHELWVLDRATGQAIGTNVTGILNGNATLPASLGTGPARARSKKLHLAIDEPAIDELADSPGADGGTRLRGQTDRVHFDIVAARPAGHEALGVVVPWSGRRLQYTVKDVARPATGSLWIDGVETVLPSGESWAVLDHGGGRWPYSRHWNWGAGSGTTDGLVIGLLLGAKWTDGTGAAENALLVDGHLHKISEKFNLGPQHHGLDGAVAHPGAQCGPDLHALSREGLRHPAGCAQQPDAPVLWPLQRRGCRQRGQAHPGGKHCGLGRGRPQPLVALSPHAPRGAGQARARLRAAPRA